MYLVNFAELLQSRRSKSMTFGHGRESLAGLRSLVKSISDGLVSGSVQRGNNIG